MTYFQWMRKYTNRELAQLYDKKDWGTLWQIVTPTVKHTVWRWMREGSGSLYVSDDLVQEAYLAAWRAIPKWNAFEATLQTWIREKVRSAVADANRRECHSGLIGDRDAKVTVISMHGDAPEEADHTFNNDEQELSDAIEASLTYGDDPPEGLWDPADERHFGEQNLLAVPPEDRDMVRRLAGIGIPQETQAEYAVAEGISVSTVEGRFRDLRKYLRENRKNRRSL